MVTGIFLFWNSLLLKSQATGGAGLNNPDLPGGGRAVRAATFAEATGVENKRVGEESQIGFAGFRRYPGIHRTALRP